ncbi:hypothetical protein Zmor_018257 [Zophobas morio]|uniref:Uncharacterized protein n=1 Tax=Zophobas morio TaxID=2755281 RepID=A0AA38IB65_9CUCU|nr:hypothetical protein Zmor_018257 [Zophobas morio]
MAFSTLQLRRSYNYQGSGGGVQFLKNVLQSQRSRNRERRNNQIENLLEKLLQQRDSPFEDGTMKCFVTKVWNPVTVDTRDILNAIVVLDHHFQEEPHNRDLTDI